MDDSTSLRDGDIAVSIGRRSRAYFARSCLWNKSVEGLVYVPYRLSSDYRERLSFNPNTFQAKAVKTSWKIALKWVKYSWAPNVNSVCQYTFVLCQACTWFLPDEMDQLVIKRRMEDLEDGTCIRFVPWTHQKDYLDIQPKSGWENLHFQKQNMLSWTICAKDAQVLYKSIHIFLIQLYSLHLGWKWIALYRSV